MGVVVGIVLLCVQLVAAMSVVAEEGEEAGVTGITSTLMGREIIQTKLFLTRGKTNTTITLRRNMVTTTDSTRKEAIANYGLKMRISGNIFFLLFFF